MTTLRLNDGTVYVDHASGEVLLECTAVTGELSYWLSCDQALELAAALIGAVMAAQQSERENREPRKCGWCGKTSCLRGDVCEGDE